MRIHAAHVHVCSVGAEKKFALFCGLGCAVLEKSTLKAQSSGNVHGGFQQFMCVEL